MATGVPVESPEYATIRECHVALVDILSMSINSVVVALISKGLIPPDVADKVQLTGTITQASKTREVTNCLSIQIKHNPKIYHKFVEVLNEQGQWTQSIVEKLTSCYNSLLLRVQDQAQKASPQNESTIINKDLHLGLTIPAGSSQEVLKSLRRVQVSVDYEYQDQVCV